jgi:2-polyprenyl-3-methyl-5-hydroxy-6-metoxy-1,4-benzoquinol methylase
MTTHFDDATIEFYSIEAPVYAATAREGVSPYLQRFLALLSPGARILELGCGGGLEAEFMIAAGFDVHATDGVPEIAAEAEKRLGVPVEVLRFDQLNAEGKFDAVYASASLLHVPINPLASILSKVHLALKPGGKHFASYKSGGAHGRDRFGRYFNYLSRAQAEFHYVNAAPWSELVIEETTGGGFDGVQGPWLTVLAAKHLD